MSLIKDPATQFIVNISVALAGIIVSSVISVLIYVKQKVRKELSYQVLPITDGITLKLINSGNQPIKVDDFDGNSPITFVFDDVVTEAEVIRTAPSSIRNRLTLSHQAECISIEPLLLNSMELIVLKVQTKPHGILRIINIDARIAGISEIPKLRLRIARFFRLLITAVLLAISSIFSILMLITGNNTTSNTVSVVISILIIVSMWMALSTFTPFRCPYKSCGYRTWNYFNLFYHLEITHSQ